MKVLQVLPSLEAGGVERGTLEIADALVKAGHESLVLSAGGRLVDELQAQGSRHLCLDLGRKSPLTLLKVRELRRLLKHEAPDIIHLRSRLPAWMVWLAWRGMDSATRPRLVSTVHGLHSVSRYSKIVTLGERVIVVSEAVRNYVLNNYPRTEPGKLRRVFRGIDPALFSRGYDPGAGWRAAWYKRHPTLKDRLVITLPGRLTRLKGHQDLLEIIGQLRARGLDAVGLIVGGEDPKRVAYAREVYDAVAGLRLQEHIVFAGHRQDIRDIYAVSDVVLSLSNRPESFGRTVLEPLSMGVPTVGYAHGGVGEILYALFPAGAVPLGDTQAVVAAIAGIIARRDAGEALDIAVNEEFLLASMQAQTLAVYDELLASPRS